MRWILAGLLLVAIAGCTAVIHPGPARVDVVAPTPSVVVTVPAGHVCTEACNHYWDGVRWVIATSGHVHGPGCGHHFYDGRWHVKAPPPGHAKPHPGRGPRK